MGLSISNLLVGVGVAFDAQLKAADNLFFAAGVDFDDPTKPMFGGSTGDSNGNPASLYDAGAGSGYLTGTRGYSSVNNGIDGDPITVRQISTADGPVYQIVNSTGTEITIDDPAATGSNATLKATRRYMVKSDGIIYDCLVHANADGSGDWRLSNPGAANGGTGTADINPLPNIDETYYCRPVGRVTFKAKEGATMARAQDELSRMGSVVQLLTRLLESIQDEAKNFSSIIR